MARYQGPFTVARGEFKGQHFESRQAYQNARAQALGFRNYADQKQFVKAPSVKELIKNTEHRSVSATGKKLTSQDKANIYKALKQVEKETGKKPGGRPTQKSWDAFLSLLHLDTEQRGRSEEKWR